MSDLAPLQVELAYQFKDEGLLRLALTHPSLSHETRLNLQHNQRLEFLGDAVLQLVLTHELYQQYPALDEGVLTKGRARMVNARALAEHGRRFNLGQYMIMSRGEEHMGGRQRASSMADAFEALVGALYLDGGFEAAREFILRNFKKGCDEIGSLPNLDNPKGELQERLQSESPDPVVYRIQSVDGPDHARIYECVVTHRGAELGRGKGQSKKAAETAAAQMALDQLKARTPAA